MLGALVVSAFLTLAVDRADPWSDDRVEVEPAVAHGPSYGPGFDRLLLDRDDPWQDAD